ncbi:MAG: DUF192 domain-containing protein [Patescibacteria group bacterium]
MKKYKLAILLAVAAIIPLFVFWKFQVKKFPESQFGNRLLTVSINGKSLAAELVATKEKKELGLSGREKLCENCAMLFVYENKGVYPFWMKDMRFDLDMAWLLGSEVVYLARDVPYARGTAETINPGNFADKIMEMNAGTISRLGIKIGDQVSIDE